MSNEKFNVSPYISFIWGICDDCLRDVYVRGKYRFARTWDRRTAPSTNTKYFYKPVQLRELADIDADLKAVEEEAAELLRDL